MSLSNKLVTWRKDLIDMSRRNPLLYYRSDGKRPSGIQFLPENPSLLFAQLHGASGMIALNTLPCAGELEPEELERRLLRLRARVREDEQDRGVRTLYLAFGMLEWYESPYSQEPIHSPLIFAPVALNYKAATGSFTLKLLDDADCEINPTLREKLNHDFKIALPVWSDVVGGNGNGNSSGNGNGNGNRAAAAPALDDLLSAVQDAIQETVSAADGRWKILRDDVQLGRFAFQKLVMYQDLQRHEADVLAHPLLGVLGGESIRPALPPGLPRPEQFDDYLRPQETLEILDADSSQQEAILLAKADVSFVLKGPPGTGKSQTIANIIAERLGQGKKVLFVSEKMAALDVVRKRLHDAGLGDFCLDLHNPRTSSAQKTAFLTALKAALDDAARPAVESSDARWQRQSSNLQERRNELNVYVRELHRLRQPLGKTAFDAYGVLVQLGETPDRDFSIPGIAAVTPSLYAMMARAADQLDACRDVLERYDSHPWRETRAASYSLELATSIRAHYTRLSEALRTQDASLSQIVELLGEDAPVSFATMPWAAALAQATLESQQPLRSWLSRDALARVRAVADDMAEQSAVYHEQLSQFTAHYNRSLLTEDLTALWQALTEDSAWAMECLRVQADSLHDTAIALRPELEQQLTAALQALTSISPAASTLADLSGSEQSETLGEINALIAVARHLVTRPASPPPAAWLDPAACAVARATAAEAQERYTQCAQMRATLEGVYQPSFFSLDLTGLAGRFRTEYRSLFRVLRPAYHRDIRLVRSQLAPGQIRNAAQIEANIMMATSLLDTEKALAATRIEYAKTLDRYFDGAQTDWETLTTTLRWVAQLHQHLTGARVSSAMADLITGPAKALRPVNAALDRLADLFAMWEDAETFCLANLQIAPLLQGAGSFDAATPMESRAAIEKLLGNLRTFWQAVETVLRHRHLPAAGQHVRWAMLCADVERAQHIQAFETRLAAKAEDYGRDFGHFYQGAATDWPKIQTAIAWTESFLTRYTGRSIPEKTAALVAHPGDATNRAALHEALATMGQTMGKANEELTFSDTTLARTALNQPDKTFEETPLAALADRVDFLVEHLDDLDRWLTCQQRLNACRQAGLDSLITNLLSQRPIPPDIGAIFRRRFHVLWLDHVRGQSPALRSFRGGEHADVIGSFRTLDAGHKTLARQRLNARLKQHRRQIFTGAGVDPRSELSQAWGALRREAQKKRHGSIRKTVVKTAPALLELKPCWMMSPLSVSQYLESGAQLFDLVIFDEASQVCPEDSISSILRGRQLIVVGDPKQLPPTRFFAKSLADDSSAEDEEDEEDEEEGRTQSILDECLSASFETRSIEWHYRSADEALIAFSNHHFYDGRLVTFPSAHGGANQGIRFEYVANSNYNRGRNRNEAMRVADIVFDYLGRHPGEEHPSLGIVALSAAQQDAIREALDNRMKRDTDFQRYRDVLSGDDPDGIFIKNLESVQGDERDAIILSVGYGPDVYGNVYKRFGPVNNAGGERRLNVAVTRARKQVIVVSSMRASDLPPDMASRGARILRDYLQYAEACSHGGAQRAAQILADQPAEGAEHTLDPSVLRFDSPLEEAVYDALTARGLTLDTQVGCSGYRIDMAVRDPEHPGAYLLGIECDGASYHSSKTARDRDRLRQWQLELMGWKLHRIWSSDWFANSARETQRVLEAVAEAMSTSTTTTALETDENEGDMVQTARQYAYAPDDRKPSQTDSSKAHPAVSEAEPVTHAFDSEARSALRAAFQRFEEQQQRSALTSDAE
jgi:very-short-patch-repair endonuclease